MRKILIGLILNAIAIWLTTELVPGIDAVIYAEGIGPQILTFLFIALIFSIVNTFLGFILRVLTFPLYILTLGLFSIIVNAMLLSVTAWATSLFGFGLRIDTFFWAGVIGALVLSLINWVLNMIMRPVMKK
ncbi:MAG: phage holin family protein [Microbacteriaceae bacterium]